jgi:hypothetical protein
MGSLWVSSAVPKTQLKIANGSIGASYTFVGIFNSSMEMINVISTLDGAIQISFDGTNDHLVVPKGSSAPCIIPMNFKTNHLVYPNLPVYAKTIDSLSSGNLYICGFSGATA